MHCNVTTVCSKKCVINCVITAQPQILSTCVLTNRSQTVSKFTAKTLTPHIGKKKTSSRTQKRPTRKVSLMAIAGSSLVESSVTTRAAPVRFPADSTILGNH